MYGDTLVHMYILYRYAYYICIYTYLPTFVLSYTRYAYRYGSRGTKWKERERERKVGEKEEGKEEEEGENGNKNEHVHVGNVIDAQVGQSRVE